MEGEHLDRLADDIEANGLHEPTAFVLSANVHRRNLSTGQRAMAVSSAAGAVARMGARFAAGDDALAGREAR